LLATTTNKGCRILMTDIFDDDAEKPKHPNAKPLFFKDPAIRAVAVAIQDRTSEGKLPQISAAGRGKLAEQILQIAFEQGIKVREDATLAEMLAKIELDSPIPSEAFMAISEILTYVYKANGEPNPFDAVFSDIWQEIQASSADELSNKADKAEAIKTVKSIDNVPPASDDKADGNTDDKIV
jgi:flagellar biosynthesis protein